MSYDFAGRIIASPAPAFFDRKIVTSDDPELAKASPQTRNAMREAIQAKILPEAAAGRPVGPELKRLGIKYIMVAKQYDYADYDYVAQQAGLSIIRDTKDIRLYKLK
jgi:hypothetical protein